MSEIVSYRTLESIGHRIVRSIHLGLKPTHDEISVQLVEALTADDVRMVIQRMVDPATMIWVIVGNHAVLEKELSELGPVRKLGGNR